MMMHLQRFKLSFSAALVVVGVALLATACGSDNSSTAASETSSGDTTAVAINDVPFTGSPETGVPNELPEPKHEALTIGLLNPCGATEICRNIYDGATEQVEEYGGTAVELDARENPDTQVSQFEQLINQGVDAIAITPIAGPELLAPILKRAAQSNIPVVAMEGLPGHVGPVPGFATDIWQQRDKMVYLEVKAAAEALGKGAKVGLITFHLPVPLFVFGAERTRYWADKFDLEIIDEVKSKDTSPDGSQVPATGMLAQNPEMEGILTYIDESAIGAALAARSAGRDIGTFSPCCAGSTGRNAIESGRITATVFMDGAAQGRAGVKAAYLAAQGEELPPEVLSGEPFIVTKENVGELGG